MSKNNKCSHGILCLNNKSQLLLLKRNFTYEFSYIIEGNLGRYIHRVQRYNRNHKSSVKDDDNMKRILDIGNRYKAYAPVLDELQSATATGISIKRISSWNIVTTKKLIRGISKSEARNLLDIMNIEDYNSLINKVNKVITFEPSHRNSMMFILSAMYIKSYDECVQLVKHMAEHSTNTSKYIPPAGREERRDDKSSVSTALRELKEETGLTKNDIFILDKQNPVSINVRSYGVNYVYMYYVSMIANDKVNSIRVDNQEVNGYLWVDLDDLSSIGFNKKLITHLNLYKNIALSNNYKTTKANNKPVNKVITNRVINHKYGVLCDLSM